MARPRAPRRPRAPEVPLTPGLSPTGRDPRPMRMDPLREVMRPGARRRAAPRPTQTTPPALRQGGTWQAPASPPAAAGPAQPPAAPAPRKPSVDVSHLPPEFQALFVRPDDSTNTSDIINGIFARTAAGVTAVDIERAGGDGQGGYLDRVGLAEDEAGAVTDPVSGKRYRIDATDNPYSMAGRLQQNFLQRRNADATRAESSRSLYGGAYASDVASTAEAEVGAQAELADVAQGGLDEFRRRRDALVLDSAEQVDKARRDQAVDKGNTPAPAAAPEPGKPKAKAKTQTPSDEFRRTMTNGPNKGKTFKVVKNSKGRWRVFADGTPREKI